jgi:UDP-N-acetylmuramate dehydrogenase
MNLQTNFSLKDYNTFRVDAKARYFLSVINIDDLYTLMQEKNFSESKKLFLGMGSNILFTRDFDGYVINNGLKGIKIIEEDEHSAIVEASGGESWDNFISFCLENNLYGMENLTAIPSSVGAAPVQNIGAYGVEQIDFFHSLTAFNINTGEIILFDKENCSFEYRTSYFKQPENKNLFILKVKYSLSKKFQPKIDYKDIKDFFGNSTNYDAKMLSQAIAEIRESKLPSISVYHNAGSFFKNPIILKEQLVELQKLLPEITFHNVDIEKVKISAAYLIEKAGLKGYRVGDVGTSHKHSLIIVNYGNATGKEIYDFSNYIIKIVLDKYNILINPEVVII